MSTSLAQKLLATTLLGCGLLAFFFFSGTEGSARAGFQPLTGAGAAWLPQTGLAIAAPAAVPGALTALLVLPSSVLPHTNTVCSADHGPAPNTFKCSVGPNSGPVICSANCDSGQRCSAFSDPPGSTGTVRCSVFQASNRSCSVVPPTAGSGAAGACSAFNGLTTSNISCSVFNGGVNRKCSARGPGGSGDECSTFGTSGAVADCSVLNSPSNMNNYCSVKGLNNKRCSTTGTGDRCSILLGSKGRCTSFGTAPLNACSVQGGPAFCSVIGGSAGNPCIQ